MKRFEYRILTRGNYERNPLSRLVKSLNQCGLEGWELVGMWGDDLYFKRELNIEGDENNSGNSDH